MAVQQFCLRWNNHQPNFISVFTNLLINESLVDVTLAAEGKQLKAHKVVLSACSTYFQSLFTANPCQHPIVILKDVKYKDLKTMVDFMYKGEVNVSQEQLPAILKTAETLKVKGLAEMPEQLSLSKSMSQSSDKCDSPPASAVASTVLRRKRFRKSSTGSGSEQTSEELAASGGTDVSSVKHEPAEEHASHHRRDTSTESEPTTREGSHSFDDEASTPRNISEDAGDSNIRWSSSEDKASTSQGAPQGWTFLESYSLPSSAETGDNSGSYQFQYTAATPGSRRKRSSNPQQDENFIAALEAVRTGGLGFCKAAKLYGVNNRTLWLEYKKRGYPVMRPSTKMRSAALNGSSVIKREKDATGSGDFVEPVPTPSMGSKRGRLLMRQHRIKKDLEMSQAEGEGESSSQRVIERQCSEPAPNLLTVPQQSYLIKQNSSPHLSQLTTPVTTSIPTVHIQAPSSEASGPIPLMSTRIRGEELRRSTSSPQCSGSGTDACEGSRSCHCPVLRPGPALGCNFCWNTIDTHGRILRRKTKYHCPECQTNLCIVPCFQEYHERHGSGSGYKGGSSSTCSPASASGTFPTIMKTSSL